MPVIKRLVCLANSRKLSGRCVAGKEISDGHAVGWVRPVSARQHEEVSEPERQYEDGRDPRVMDIMDVPLLEPRPKSYQQENWLLDPDRYWVKVGRYRWDHLEQLADPVAQLWINGHGTRRGRNDRIPLADTDALTSSLRLVLVEKLRLSVFAPGEAFDNPTRRVQGRFRHDGIEYRLWVTDPRYERAYLAKPDGDYDLGESFLAVSLGEPAEDGFCYKLVAAVIERR